MDQIEATVDTFGDTIYTRPDMWIILAVYIGDGWAIPSISYGPFTDRLRVEETKAYLMNGNIWRHIRIVHIPGE